MKKIKIRNLRGIWINISWMWQEGAKNFLIKKSEVHLWKLQLPLPPKVQEVLSAFLQPEEKTRAARFHFEKDRERFTQFRGFLRYLLGQYLQILPGEISLQENAQGKPGLAPGQGTLHFNLAHSEGMGLYAFTLLGEIGVDVEKIKERYDGEKLADRNFSSKESEFLRSVPDNMKAKTFFRLWTLKEAYLKALGLGFSGGLDTFSVQLQVGEGMAHLMGRHPEDPQENWLLKYFPVGEGFVGALAAPEGVEEIRYFDGNRIQIYK